MSKNKLRVLVIALLAITIAVFIGFDLNRFLSFEYLKGQQAAFQAYYLENQLVTLVSYFLVYVLVTAVSLPGATALTLAGGFLFGLIPALIMVSFASTIGATLAFSASRFVLRDFVQIKFADKLKTVNEGVKREGKFYLFSLRLIPVFPFFIINVVMGLTPLRVFEFYWVSQLGMLPGTFVYVNAGTQLGQIQSPAEIMSLELLISLALLGVFPIVAKKIIAVGKTRRSK